MYQNVKDVYQILERNRKAQNQLLEKQTSIAGEHTTTAYTRGFIAGLDSALGMLNVLLDEYEAFEDAGYYSQTHQPTPHDLEVSDALDFVSFLKQCRP